MNADSLQHDKARIAAMFDSLAGEYDGERSWFSHFGWRLVELAGVQPGHAVLDVATGQGAVLFPAATAAGSAGTVIGVDLSPAMVRQAAAEAARRGVTAELQVMDAEHLSFPGRSFDRVCCAFGLMFFSRPGHVLRSIRRLLKRDGRLAVSTWRVHPLADLEQVLCELHFSSAAEELPFGSRDELEQLLWAAGFSTIQILPETAQFAFSDVDHYWEAAMATGMRPRLQRLDTCQVAVVRRLLAERLQTRTSCGRLHVGATALLATASP